MKKLHLFPTFYLDTPLIPGRCFDVFAPEKITCDTALFIIHGGGWKAGSRSDFHQLMEAFNQRGILCASTDYRMGAGVTAFDQLADVREAYDAFVTYLKERHLPLKIAVHGASAGAHLASLLLCAKPGECGEVVDLQNEWIAPVSGILQATPVEFTPWEDIFPWTWLDMQSIAGVPYEKAPAVYEKLSLRNYIGKGNPVLFFAEAQCEHIFPSEMTWQLVQKHRSLGIPSQWKMYRNVEHGFFYALTRWQQREMLEDVVSFLTTGKPTHSEKNEIR